jgi:CheY-like chemotaxis protein
MSAARARRQQHAEFFCVSYEVMPLSILIVDDEPDVAMLFRQQFRREIREDVYVLHFALSAAEALERLANKIEPQLIVILSDINMPGMDGLALLREIKTRRPELPVMMLTAYGDDERRRRGGGGGGGGGVGGDGGGGVWGDLFCVAF